GDFLQPSAQDDVLLSDLLDKCRRENLLRHLLFYHQRKSERLRRRHYHPRTIGHSGNTHSSRTETGTPGRGGAGRFGLVSVAATSRASCGWSVANAMSKSRQGGGN